MKYHINLLVMKINFYCYYYDQFSNEDVIEVIVYCMFAY